MKQKVIMSRYSLLATLLTLICLVAVGAFACRVGSNDSFFLYCVLFSAMLIISLFYVPLEIEADPERLTIIRAFARKHIPIKDIVEIRMCAPEIPTFRMMGSGGFMGHWGWFRSKNLGKYFAYFGRSSDCIFIRLRDDRRYMISCGEPHEMVAYVRSHMADQATNPAREE